MNIFIVSLFCLRHIHLLYMYMLSRVFYHVLLSYSPVQLEWNMKLWWTHNEALIAFLMAYQHTRDVTMMEKFAQVFDYCNSKVTRGQC